MRLFCVATLSVLCLTTVAAAAPMAMSDDPADAAFHSAMDGMMAGMHQAMPTGDNDTDFAQMMLPHHRAAVDMAKAELQYGKDPELKTLAASVVAAQDQEIGLMKAWLAKRGK